jgi:hypothetical protein
MAMGTPVYYGADFMTSAAEARRRREEKGPDRISRIHMIEKHVLNALRLIL